MNVERYFQSGVKLFGTIDRKKLRNEKHLKWIRSRFCYITGKPAEEAHHEQKKSQGRNDFLTLPMTVEKHNEYHTTPLAKFEVNNSVDVKDALIAQLVERILFLEGIVGRN